MTPARFNQALEALHWSTETLAGILGCDESLTAAYSMGLTEVPMKLGVWLEVLAQAHEAAEHGRPVGLKGKPYSGALD
ncbi:MAG TPA: hypothetical protein VGN60_07695 [Devosia sp.]|jgi:hypothetical protein|nr:hypothetical protein [Devosia sp.]